MAGGKSSNGLKKSWFLGVGLSKAPRRANGTAKGMRLLYPRLRKDQRGTPMETFITGNYGTLTDQFNRLKQTNPSATSKNTMYRDSATGGLKSNWKRAFNKGLKPQIIRLMKSRLGMSSVQAKKEAANLFSVSFGADPKQK